MLIPAAPSIAQLTQAARADGAPRRLTIPIALPAIVLLLVLFVLPGLGRRRF
jgi:hypothetical protein